MVTQLNDGHTRTSSYLHVVLLPPLIFSSGWFPNCYLSYNNILPAPIVFLDNGVFIVPDSVELINNIGPAFASVLVAKGFDWERLAGAEVIEIGGLPVFDYIDQIAKTVSGNYLDHNVRVNSVVSSYRIVGSQWSQRFGDHASELFPRQTSLDILLIPKGSTSGTPVTVNVPFVASFICQNLYRWIILVCPFPPMLMCQDLTCRFIIAGRTIALQPIQQMVSTDLPKAISRLFSLELRSRKPSHNQIQLSAFLITSCPL